MATKLKTEIEALDTLLAVTDPKGMLSKMVVRRRDNFSKRLKPATSHAAYLAAAPKVRAHLAKGVALFGAKAPKAR